MKTLIFLILCILPGRLFSQGAVVYDARNDVNMTNQYLLGLKDFAEAKQQTSILSDTYDFYKKAEDALQKISRAVNDFYKIQEIVKTQVETIKLYGYYTSQARGFTHVSKSEITAFTNLIASFNESSNQLFKHAQSILKPDYYKMSDSERVQFLSDIDNQMAEKKTLMNIRFNKIKAKEDDLAILSYYKRM